MLRITLLLAFLNDYAERQYHYPTYRLYFLKIVLRVAAILLLL